MNETPNVLIRLGEALGPEGALVVLLLVCAGAVWVVMSVRSNQADHARFEANVDEGLERLEKMIETWRKETREELRSIHARLDRIIDGKPPSQPG